MNAPATFPDRTTRIAAAVNRAPDKNQQADKVIALLNVWKRQNIDAARGHASDAFWLLRTEYHLASALSDLFGCDSFDEMREAASSELWREHGWNASEGRALDASERSL